MKNFYTQVLKSNTQQYSIDLLLRRNLAPLITTIRYDRVDPGLFNLIFKKVQMSISGLGQKSGGATGDNQIPPTEFA